MCLNFDEYYAILRYCDQQDCAKARYVIAEIQSTRYRNRKQSRLMVDGRVLACVCDRRWSSVVGVLPFAFVRAPCRGQAGATDIFAGVS